MDLRISLTSATGDDEELVIPEGITQIDTGALRLCTSMRRVTIPTTCTRIDEAAFKGCTALEEAVIPDSVTYLGKHAFSGCTSLRRVVLPAATAAVLAGTFSGCTALERVEGAGGIKRIEREAFSRCSSLVELTGNPLSYIDSRAFHSCTALERVEFGERLDYAGEMAFSRCESLRDVTLPAQIGTLRNDLFDGCEHVRVGDPDLAERFPNALPRHLCEGWGRLRPIDRNKLAREFRDRHEDDRVALEQRRAQIEREYEELGELASHLGILDLKRRDRALERQQDIEAELEDIDALLAEIRNPQWETLVDDFNERRRATREGATGESARGA
ncbi:leucine-rich repeat domain-containing protein [Eggerthellaceae bacterium zg-1084]|uniref:leucine-rich repeat domain-containing protein n=1 Tax=Berryella wangjianweii TaxID=2734634 RepID=UPI00155245CF|nr:leucine-rich repeat domain-containing protein [Berryella wangjianweii]NPD31392.1 leucine-rich repeat domain-containing protein [Berryella wangjianweii]